MNNGLRLRIRPRYSELGTWEAEEAMDLGCDEGQREEYRQHFC
jgi:hypothetical protein